jgi:SAM-dependent methyltransferase
MPPPDAPSPQGTSAPRDFLRDCLREWPSSHALLRAIECRKLARHPLAAPILDVGCGDGVLTGFLFPDPLAAGVDLNPREVRRASRNPAHRGVMAASATHLPFADRSFRGVFSNCVLEHVDQLDLALQEIGRVLQPQGALLTTVPTPRWESEGPLPILRRLGLRGLSDLLNRLLRSLWHHVTMEEEGAWRDRLARARLRLVVWEPYMGPSAYAAYGRWLPFSLFSFVLRRLTGRWLISRTLRRLVVPCLAGLLRRAYLAEEPVGACALILAVKETDA